MKLTFEEIRNRLGLKPFKEFEKRIRSLGFKSRTGKTTRLLLKAIELSQTEKVRIIGCSLAISRHLTQVAKDMCRKIGIDNSNIDKPIYLVEGGSLDGQGGENLFLDYQLSLQMENVLNLRKFKLFY